MHPRPVREEVFSFQEKNNELCVGWPVSSRGHKCVHATAHSGLRISHRSTRRGANDSAVFVVSSSPSPSPSSSCSTFSSDARAPRDPLRRRRHVGHRGWAPNSFPSSTQLETLFARREYQCSRVHTRRILLPGLATRSLSSST